MSKRPETGPPFADELYKAIGQSRFWRIVALPVLQWLAQRRPDTFDQQNRALLTALAAQENAAEVARFITHEQVQISDSPETQAAAAAFVEAIKKGNCVVYFDHPYPFDAVFAGLGLVQLLDKAGVSLSRAVVPAAAMLFIYKDNAGRVSLDRLLRYALFTQTAKAISSGTVIDIRPLIRPFELSKPQFWLTASLLLRRNPLTAPKSLVREYFEAVQAAFTANESGSLLLISSTGGLTSPDTVAPQNPDRPLLHPSIHETVVRAATATGAPIHVFHVGAYPNPSEGLELTPNTFMSTVHRVALREGGPVLPIAGSSTTNGGSKDFKAAAAETYQDWSDWLHESTDSLRRESPVAVEDLILLREV